MQPSKIEALASLLNASVADVVGFVDCLRVWTDKGLTVEQAIERHMATMRRMMSKAGEACANSGSVAASEFRALTQIAAGEVWESVRGAQ